MSDGVTSQLPEQARTASVPLHVTWMVEVQGLEVIIEGMAHYDFPLYYLKYLEKGEVC